MRSLVNAAPIFWISCPAHRGSIGLSNRPGCRFSWTLGPRLGRQRWPASCAFVRVARMAGRNSAEFSKGQAFFRVAVRVAPEAFITSQLIGFL